MALAKRWWLSLLAACALAPSQGGAAERPTVAVLWMGNEQTLDAGERLAGDVNSALDHSSARPVASAEERRQLVRGGQLSKVDQALHDGEVAFGSLQFAAAATAFETAQRILLEEAVMPLVLTRWARTQRGLLASYDQLGRNDDAAVAAERLSWLGNGAEVAQLLAKHRVDRSYEPTRPPVQITTDPPGAEVYRNLKDMGVSPLTIPGGDPSVDVIDVIEQRSRRVHAPLPGGGEVKLTLPVEDRVEVLVDLIRIAAPDAPTALVTALGQRVGAQRLLALMPSGASTVRARWFDVARGAWAADSIDVDSGGQPAVDRLVAYVSPQPPAPPAPAVAVVAAAPPPATKKVKGPWAKWYTWVAAGAVVAGVVTLVLVDRVGSDKLTVTASH